MPLLPVKGNMYDFCTHTFNIIKGKCPHQCQYCYMRQFELKHTRLDRKEFKTDLGSGNFIFFGSSCDVFAYGIPKDWIIECLKYLCAFENKYLLQTKNPARISDFFQYLPNDVIIGTTIETNRSYPAMGKAPDTASRALAMKRLSKDFLTMVTTEPIMDFDLTMLMLYVESCNPEWINIGADSKGHNLPEPKKKKVINLIEGLASDGFEIKEKRNLGRILLPSDIKSLAKGDAGRFLNG